MRQGRQSSIDSWIVWKEWTKADYEYQIELAGSKQVSSTYFCTTTTTPSSPSISWTVEVFARNATSLQWSKKKQNLHTHPSHWQKKSTLRTTKHFQLGKSFSGRSLETRIAAGKIFQPDFLGTSSRSPSEYSDLLWLDGTKSISV